MGSNRYSRAGTILKAALDNDTCVFISHRLADLDVAKAVGRYLTEVVGIDIYLSDSDDHLQVALQSGDDAKIVEYIEGGLSSSSHLLGIISNRTRDSWWVPFEFGAARQRRLSIAQLLLEEITEAPSYLRVAEVLRDSDDLSKWVAMAGLLKAAAAPVPDIPRVAKYKAAYPRWT